jgi:hypothetical protein
MDEGRNVILVFPELIDLATTEEEQETRRKAFEVESVTHCVSRVLSYCVY